MIRRACVASGTEHGVGCGASALSDLRFRPVGMIRRACVASGTEHGVGCGASALSDLRFRPVGMIRRACVASGTEHGVGCGASALSDLRFRPVGMIRRISVASGIGTRCRMRRERLIRPTVQACRHDKTHQRRIRHRHTVSDAARAPYPTYGSGL